MNKTAMNDRTETPPDNAPDPSKRRRNLVLGAILIVAVVAMYASIFLRLHFNPLE